MSDVNPGANRINELIRNYDPPRSDETEPSWECVAERIAMVMKMHTPEEQVVIANSIASQIMKTGGVDVPSNVDHEKHKGIYTCDEYAPFDKLDGGVITVTEDKEEEDGGSDAALKKDLPSKVREEPSELDSDEPTLIASVSPCLETIKVGEREKTNGEEEVEKGEVEVMMEKQERVEEADEETKVNLVKITEKVKELESIIEEEDSQKEEKKKGNEAEVGIVKGEEGELELMYKLKGEAKVYPREIRDQAEEIRTGETRAELEEANGGEVEVMADNSKGKEQVVPQNIREPVEEAKKKEIKSEVEKRMDGGIGEMGEVGFNVEEEIPQNEPFEEVMIKEEWNREENRNDEEVGGMKFENQLRGDGDAAAIVAIEEGEILEQEEDEEELTSWSSISDLDTVSSLSSISSLSFGEIISLSGEDEGELTADEIDDEVWGDYTNAENEDEESEEAFIVSKIILPDVDDTALQTAVDQTDLISICPKGQGLTKVGSTRRGFWSKIFGRRQSKKDKKVKKIAVEQETKPKKYSKMAEIIFACCCVQPSD